MTLYDKEDREVPAGETGRIFVASGFPFEGYTGGDTKATIGDLMSSGDVGHFDSAGRLFIDGRDDDMIISGGENLFPSEVEDLLAGHPAVREVAVVGVDDEAWGQRLKAIVVLQDGESVTDPPAVGSPGTGDASDGSTSRSVTAWEARPSDPAASALKLEVRHVVVTRRRTVRASSAVVAVIDGS